MTKKNDVLYAKDPCRNGVQTGMALLDFTVDTV